MLPCVINATHAHAPAAAASTCTWQRPVTHVVVELLQRIAEAVEDALSAATRHDVDVADLLRLRRVVRLLGNDPESVYTSQTDRLYRTYTRHSSELLHLI